MNWWWRATWFIACACVAKSAAAHAPPQATGIQWFADGDGERALVRTNRGLIVEGRSPRTFRILCNDAFEASLAEVPPVVIQSDGSLLLGTYQSGLVFSTADRCNFQPVEGAFKGLYPIDLKSGAEGEVYAAVLPYDGSSAELLESSERGSVAKTLTTMPGAPTALEIAPSDRLRLYVSITTAEGNLSFGHLFTSTDSGQSFVDHPIDLDASELRVFVLAIAPEEPELLFVRTQSRDGITPERLLRSKDGGETFETVLTVPGPISATVQTGGVVWVGAADGLYRSSDSGDSFARVGENDVTRVTCLATRGRAVYACGYSAGEFGVLVSENGSGVFSWFLRFPQVTARLDCSPESDERARCDEAFADWSEEQGPNSEAGGGGAPPHPDPGAATHASGCQLGLGVPASRSLMLPALTLGLAAALRYRRRKTTVTAVSAGR